MKHEYFMQEALKEAKKAYQQKETPIGAVAVYQNEIIARAYNKRETKQTIQRRMLPLMQNSLSFKRHVKS